VPLAQTAVGDACVEVHVAEGDGPRVFPRKAT
jgi:hypothetical protein